MRFPTIWYVRPAKAQTSLRIRADWSEPLLVAWIFYDCWATDWTLFGVSKLKRRLQRLVRIYTCQNVKLLEITCHGSFWVDSLWVKRYWLHGKRANFLCLHYLLRLIKLLWLHMKANQLYPHKGNSLLFRENVNELLIEWNLELVGGTLSTHIVCLAQLQSRHYF